MAAAVHGEIKSGGEAAEQAAQRQLHGGGQIRATRKYKKTYFRGGGAAGGAPCVRQRRLTIRQCPLWFSLRSVLVASARPALLELSDQHQSGYRRLLIGNRRASAGGTGCEQGCVSWGSAGRSPGLPATDVVWCSLDGCTRRRELEPTFSIWSASRRSLASLRLGLNVSGSSSALIDVPCLELTSSLVVIYKNGTHLYVYKSNKNSLISKRKSNIELYREPQPAYRHDLQLTGVQVTSV